MRKMPLLLQRFTQTQTLDALWLLAIAAYILAGIALVPLHGDESTLIYMGRDFYYQVVQGDSSLVMYSDDPDSVIDSGATQQQLRLMNGTLPKYLYGAIAYLSGYEIDAINQQWVWGAGWDWNHANGHVPPPDLLYRARLVSALLTAAGAWALFGIGYSLRGRGTAYLASGYYALNPAILLNGRRAMMEGGLLAFGLLAVLAGLWLMQYRHWWLYVLFGVLSGLAVASKHTAVIYVIAVFLAAGGYLLLNPTKNRRPARALTGFIAAGLLSLLVFYALNPAWWDNPLTRAQQVLSMRTDFIQGQISTFESYDSFSEQVTGFITQVVSVPPMYSETPVDAFVANQQALIATYEQSLLNGVHPGAMGGALLAFCALAGLVALWRDSALDSSGRWLLMALVVCVGAFTLLLTPLPWQRYYLPLYPVMALCVAIGVMYVASLIVPFLKRLLWNVCAKICLWWLRPYTPGRDCHPCTLYKDSK